MADPINTHFIQLGAHFIAQPGSFYAIVNAVVSAGVANDVVPNKQTVATPVVVDNIL
jgi:hypothetical protein